MEDKVIDLEAGAGGAKVLDATDLQSGESLAGRDLQGWKLVGDFSGRNFERTDLRGSVLDDCILKGIHAARANFKGASMQRVDARRADLRGACLVGVCAQDARFCRANASQARMAGMWGGPYTDEAPKVKELEDGTMPPMEPLPNEEVLRYPMTVVPTAEAEKQDAEDAATEAMGMNMRHMDAR